MSRSLAFSVNFFWLLLIAASQQCAAYVENCFNCSAEVDISGNIVTLS